MTHPRKKGLTKQELKLKARIQSYETISDKKGFTKPGSLKK